MAAKCLVTGCAGFIGSHLCERLLKDGYEVIGVDCFTDYYSRQIKERNMDGFKTHKNFQFISNNLNDMDLSKLLENVDYVFHEAAQAGVRASWGAGFDTYIFCNITATQKLLEAAKGKQLKKFVYASSSSVYGDSPLPMKEGNLLKPVSPYGVTKLAAENLCYLYWKNYGVPTVSLRYFTVYGTRQRPDMGLHKFISAVLKGEEIAIFGDGSQTRDFTYVDDIITANIKCLKLEKIGVSMNIGGGSRVTVNEVLDFIQTITGKSTRVVYTDKAKGDVSDTLADISLARQLIDYTPQVKIKAGLEQHIKFLKESLKID